MLLTTSPLSQTVTPSRTPSPSSVTYFMDDPVVVLTQTTGRLNDLKPLLCYVI